jgi:hypothetical protein
VHAPTPVCQRRENDDESRSFKMHKIFSILNLLHPTATDCQRVFRFEFQVCTISRADGGKSVGKCGGAGVRFRVEYKTSAGLSTAHRPVTHHLRT